MSEFIPDKQSIETEDRIVLRNRVLGRVTALEGFSTLMQNIGKTYDCRIRLPHFNPFITTTTAAWSQFYNQDPSAIPRNDSFAEPLPVVLGPILPPTLIKRKKGPFFTDLRIAIPNAADQIVQERLELHRLSGAKPVADYKYFDPMNIYAVIARMEVRRSTDDSQIQSKMDQVADFCGNLLEGLGVEFAPTGFLPEPAKQTA